MNLISKIVTLEGPESTQLPSGCPAWMSALPLWAASSWLCIRLRPDGSADCLFQEGSGRAKATRHAALAEGLSRYAPLPMIVLDCRTITSLPEGYWTLLQDALTPGGAIFVCFARPALQVKRIRCAAPRLRPAGWHVIEPCQEGTWSLRPWTTEMLRLVNKELRPPYGIGAWLLQIKHRWFPSRRQVFCLPIWRDEAE